MINKPTKPNKMKTSTKKFIKRELERRTELIESPVFRLQCLEIAKKLGLTQEEWDKNRAIFYMFIANEVCAIENNK